MANFDAPIKEDRAEIRKANKEDSYGFQLKLSTGQINFCVIFWNSVLISTCCSLFN